MFSVEYRDQVRDYVLELADTDKRVTAGAVVALQSYSALISNLRCFRLRWLLSEGRTGLALVKAGRTQNTRIIPLQAEILATLQGFDRR